MEIDEHLSTEPLCDRPDWRAWAKETIETFHAGQVGALVGERFCHRGWPPDVVRAFLGAEVVKPVSGEIQRILYG